MEYQLMEADNPGRLSILVTEKLGQGFILYGSPFYSPSYSPAEEYSESYYCQAVMK
jgi:hypothetical protein